MKLTCQEVADHERYVDFPDEVRRTRTICIHSSNRPRIETKSLVHVTVTHKGNVREGTYCVDARGSKIGHLIASETHLKELGVRAGAEVEFTIRPATASESVSWLKDNAVPERKALAFMLDEAIKASSAAVQAANDAKISTQSAGEAAIKAESAAQIAKVNFDNALKAEREAEVQRKRGVIYAAAAFVAGALIDVGMIEEKFSVEVPWWFVLLLILVAVTACLVARRIRE